MKTIQTFYNTKWHNHVLCPLFIILLSLGVPTSNIYGQLNCGTGGCSKYNSLDCPDTPCAGQCDFTLAVEHPLSPDACPDDNGVPMGFSCVRIIQPEPIFVNHLSR